MQFTLKDKAKHLGCKPKKTDERTLQLAHYLLFKVGAALPPTPVGFGWSKGVKSWGVMLNDNEGDCTIATVGHAIQTWTQNVGPMLTIPDADVQAGYVAVTGEEGAAFDPATHANDNGCAILDVLNYWRQVGVGGHKILAFMALDHANKPEILLGGELFGGLYGGVNLPLTARDQLNAGQVWDVPAGGAVGRGKPRSWGGHATWIVDANGIGPVCITWGALQQMTWAFWFTYYSEAYAVLDPEWIDANGVSGSGFDLATLTADLAAITGQPIPSPVNPPSPVKPPTPAPPWLAAVKATNDAEFGQLVQTFRNVRGAAAVLNAAATALDAAYAKMVA